MKKTADRAEHGADDNRGLTVTAAVMAERRLWDSIETIRDGFC